MMGFRIRLVACAIGLAMAVMAASKAAAETKQLCKPSLSFKNVSFSPMLPPNNERKWTATVLVDASSCAPNSAGSFEVEFTRYKEIGLDLDFREQFIWLPPSVLIGLDFGADEAVGRYAIVSVSACFCRH